MKTTASQPPPPPKPPAGPPKPPRPSGPGRATEALHPVSELAEIWRCSTDHIYHLISKGELRSVQLGLGRAMTRVPASAAEEFVAKRSRKARAA